MLDHANALGAQPPPDRWPFGRPLLAVEQRDRGEPEVRHELEARIHDRGHRAVQAAVNQALGHRSGRSACEEAMTRGF